MSQRLKNFVKLVKNYCCTNRNTSLSAVCWRSGTTMVLHWTPGSRSGLVAICCSYFDYQSSEMRKMFGDEVFTIKMTALSRVTSLFPTETESQPSIMKARQKRSNNKLPLERSQFLVTTKGFKNFRRVSNN